MSGNFRNPRSKNAGSILASALVFLVGTLGVAIVAAAGGGDPVGVLLVLGGGVILCICLFWLLSNLTKVSPKAVYGWVFSKNARPIADYEPRRRGEKREEYGTNHPPSAEELQETRDDSRTWVPSNTRQSRSKPKQG